MLPQAAKWAETLPYHAATIDLLRRGTALSGDTTMVHGDVRTCSRDRKPSERAACRKEPHQPERKRWGKSWTRRQELHDPGFYAAFPWGGYARDKGDAPSTAHPTITLPGGLSETIVEVRRQARTPPGQVR